MPRNSSGTYTLPSGNPVSSGTLIEASWANTTLSDLASAMTNSLSRGGEGGMTAALRLFDGTVSLPGLAFTSETSTGLYRAGAGDMRLAITGSQVMQFLATGVAVTGTLSATGAVSFTGQTATLENATAYYPQLINRNKTNDANGSYMILEKVRNTSVVQNGDILGNLVFRGYDGAAYLQGAFINAVVSATPGTNDMPADLVFGTTADGGAGPTERLRISNTGAGTATADWTFNGVRVGRGAGSVSTNTAVGASALAANTTGSLNTAFGYNALTLADANNNSAFGYNALSANTSGTPNSAFGRSALASNTTGASNTGIGYGAVQSNTTGGSNVGVGHQALVNNTTASNNTAVGYQAGYSNTTGTRSIAIGGQALYTNSTSNYNLAIGYQAGYNTTGQGNVLVGDHAGYNLTTGYANTFIGPNWSAGGACGENVTTGYKNTIIGAYNGNQGGLNITTANNYIVLSDGDGNPRMYANSSNTWYMNSNSGERYVWFQFNIAGSGKSNIYWDNTNTNLYVQNSSGGVYLTNTGTSWTSNSDERLKENLTPIENGLSKVCSLRSVIGNFIADETKKPTPFLIAQDVQAVLPEAVTTSTLKDDETETQYLGVAYTEVIPLLVAAIKELNAQQAALKAEFDAYKATHP